MPRDHYLNNAAFRVYARTATYRERRRKALWGNVLASALTLTDFALVILKIWTVQP